MEVWARKASWFDKEEQNLLEQCCKTHRGIVHAVPNAIAVFNVTIVVARVQRKALVHQHSIQVIQRVS